MIDRFLNRYPMISLLRERIPCFFPEIGDREAWENLPEEDRQGLLHLAEEYRTRPYPMLTATQFMAFVRNGSRKAFENPYFFRRKKLIASFLASCLTGEDVWLDDVVDGIWCVCEESAWFLNAHNTRLRTDPPRALPDVERPFLDLFAGQTAMILSLIFAVMGEKLDGVSPFLRRRVRKEIGERVLEPFMAHDDFWWMGFVRGEKVNNWNPWILSNVMLTASVWIGDRRSLAECLDRACRLLDHYLDAMPEDGGCDEGAAYWNMAGGAVLDCLELLETVTDGKLCFWEDPKLRNIVSFPMKAELENGWFVNFADCDARPYLSGERLQYAGEKLKDIHLASRGCALRRGPCYELTDTPQLWRLLNELFHPRCSVGAAEEKSRDVWLPCLQVRVYEKNGMFLAAKGGHNDESHNHNDVGSFILTVDGEPEIVDAGNMVYTAKTFSEERYTIWNTRSAYHNLPLIGGKEQNPGRNFAAKDVQCLPDGISLDLADAYPESAEVLECQRELRLVNEGLVLRDTVLCKKEQPVTWIFMLRHAPEIRENVVETGRLTLCLPEGMAARAEELPVTDPRMANHYPGSLWRLRCEGQPGKTHTVQFTFQRKKTEGETNMRNDPKAVSEKIIEKFRASVPVAAKEGIIPYKSEGGKWIASPFDGNSWWTGGFWPALMWQLFRMTGDELFSTEARRVEKLLTDEFRAYRKLNHDMGFMYLISCGADQKLTGNEQARTDMLHAASLLMGRFNPVGFIRAWDGSDRVGYAIIDCMMNLSLLFRATRETGDPRFQNVARIHADTTLREFLREDGSVSHIIEFDPMTGKRVAEHPGQGYCLGSSWSRGQAWGLYGFTLAALNTGEEKYLQAARRIADYFIAHIRADGLTDCDFRQPEGEERIDNIAGACAACGLLELEKLCGSPAYRAAAEKLLDGLIDSCCDWTENSRGILTHCTASYHDDGAGRHTNLMYGDYFFTEAIAKLLGTDPMLWI